MLCCRCTLAGDRGGDDECRDYYALAGQPFGEGLHIAKRQGVAVYDIYGDHLGSTSLIANASGAVVVETCYLPYGQVYRQWGASQHPAGAGRTLVSRANAWLNSTFIMNSAISNVFPENLLEGRYSIGNVVQLAAQSRMQSAVTGAFGNILSGIGETAANRFIRRIE